jgi:hypothetical protein
MKFNDTAQRVIVFVMTLMLTLFIGTAILVGAFDLAPSVAAGLSLLLGIVLAGSGSAYEPTRRFFSSIFIP